MSGNTYNTLSLSPTIPLLPTFYTFLIIDIINTFDSAPKWRLLERDLANEMVRLDIGCDGTDPPTSPLLIISSTVMAAATMSSSPITQVSQVPTQTNLQPQLLTRLLLDLRGK
jgi:hypothetical protein